MRPTWHRHSRMYLRRWNKIVGRKAPSSCYNDNCTNGPNIFWEMLLALLSADHTGCVGCSPTGLIKLIAPSGTDAEAVRSPFFSLESKLNSRQNAEVVRDRGELCHTKSQSSSSCCGRILSSLTWEAECSCSTYSVQSGHFFPNSQLWQPLFVPASIFGREMVCYSTTVQILTCQSS